jgi:DNA-binding MarR family transcriptional regulator
MAAEELGGRHMELLRVLHEVGANNPDGVADMDRVAQRLGLDTVARGEDRAEFEARVSALEEAGYVEKQGSDLRTSYGKLSVTEEGRKALEAS